MSDEQSDKREERRAWQTPGTYGWSRVDSGWHELRRTSEAGEPAAAKSTEERELERRLLSLAVAHSPLTIVVLDKAGRILLASGSGARAFAEEPAALVGRTADEALVELPEARRAVARALAGKKASWGGVVDGRYHELHLAPILGPEGGLLLVAGVALDRTAEQRAESTLHAWHVHLERTAASSMLALAAVVEEREPTTLGHQRRTAELAVAVARDLGWAERRIANLRIAAQLHDVGRLSCPTEALNRPGPLRPAEVEAVKQHSEAGAAMLAAAEFTPAVVGPVRQHHERLDGSGYPDGLEGQHILPAARIIAVADVYEAMTSPRPFRDAFTPADALAELKAERGRLYDAEAVDAFTRIFARGASPGG